MDRRKTILIAVLVNAGLLVLLFIMALGHEDAPIKNPEMPQMAAHERGPLFPEFQEQDENPIALVEENREPVLLQMPQVAAQPVHQLPPIAAAIQEPAPSLAPASAQPAVQSQNSYADVAVKKGDTLEKIARLHQTSVDEIVRLNQLSSSFLRIGQVLKIPGKSSASPKPLAAPEKRPAPAGQLEYYTVKVGDNPWTIAMKHHLKVDELLKLNELNEEKARRLRPGDRLRIR